MVRSRAVACRACAPDTGAGSERGLAFSGLRRRGVYGHRSHHERRARNRSDAHRSHRNDGPRWRENPPKPRCTRVHRRPGYIAIFAALAGLIPAYRAVRIHPAEALRSE